MLWTLSKKKFDGWGDWGVEKVGKVEKLHYAGCMAQPDMQTQNFLKKRKERKKRKEKIDREGNSNNRRGRGQDEEK